MCLCIFHNSLVHLLWNNCILIVEVKSKTPETFTRYGIFLYLVACFCQPQVLKNHELGPNIIRF